MRRWPRALISALISALGLLGCGDEAARVDSPPTGPAAPTTQSAPTPQGAPATQGAPTTQAADGADEATRRARFAERPVITPPSPLPAEWKALVTDLDGRLLAATVAWRTRVDGKPLVTEIAMQFRVFGHDAPVEAALLGALKTRGFVGDTLPETAAEVDGARFHVEVARLKGQAPRETQFDLTWQREPTAADNQAVCKKPPALPLPGEAPAWLDPVTNARSTRRRVALRLELSREARAVEVAMLFQNGYAQDEAVGHYTELAKQRGFKLSEGSGLRQTWQHTDGQRLAWRPTRRDLGLGCEEAGPVLELTWQGPGGAGR